MKKVLLLVLCFVMILSVSITTVFADDIIGDPNEPLEYSFVIESSNEDDEINPRADIIGWRYKIMNGHLYRRKYNYTKQVWIGHWERV